MLTASLSLAAPVEILVPESQVSSVLPRIHVVGRTEASQVAIHLNGKPHSTVAVTDSIFHALVWLPYGLNQILVTPMVPPPEPEVTTASLPEPSLVELGNQAVKLEVLCGPRITREYQKMYPAYQFHEAVSHDECLACHSPQLITGKPGEDAEWCYRCHSIIRQQFSSHVIGDENLCTSCHRLSADLTRQKTGVYTDMNPCFLCHQDKIGEFAQDFIHGPVAGGTCTVCHNPHGSEFEDNLRSPVPVLCLFCHTSIDNMAGSVQHKPFADGHCSDCHDPHATGNRWVLVKNSGELCIGCHEKEVADGNHRHPVDAKPRTKLKRDLALNDEGRMECLTCHHPHAGEANFLLRTSGGHACLGCHPEHR